MSINTYVLINNAIERTVVMCREMWNRVNVFVALFSHYRLLIKMALHISVSDFCQLFDGLNYEEQKDSQ